MLCRIAGNNAPDNDFYSMTEISTKPDSAPAAAEREEVREWLQALDDVITVGGHKTTEVILDALLDRARQAGLAIPYGVTTPYVNTIARALETTMPGDPNLDHQIRSLTRWNALAMVVKANRISSELGGHIASFASCATLYDVGFNHFWRGPKSPGGGDLIYFQGHASPGNYARSYIEGRLSANQLDYFRREVEAGPGRGLTSYPHPWLMPDYWQFPTVSMGLGPIMAIYHARFLKYLAARDLVKPNDRNVWAFLGDGECDEPESLGAISMAGREKLGNLIFVINCNLQRLDGPVRGNGKIIQELEGVFTGAGWNVVKVIWGSRWDALLENDNDGLLRKRMEEVVDGEYQNLKSSDGAAVREVFFGKYPELKKRVAHMSDDDIWQLDRGGHDPIKVYAAYLQAVRTTDKPTVILAKTVKGYGMGDGGEGQNRAHQQKKLGDEEILAFKRRFDVPISDEDALKLEYIRPAPDDPAMRYMMERREQLGGFLPHREDKAPRLDIPPIDFLTKILEGTGEKSMSTTMAFTRILTALLRISQFKDIIVPIIPDEARTFGMEGFFRQLGIYSSVGQLYTPQDHGQVMYYREDKKGQILEEGINEAGAVSSWIASATSTWNHGINTIPFYIFYSMFGSQRVGDLLWAAGDMRCRGFLLGATAGRTTLAGEGLQHQDGTSLLNVSSIPNCLAYDPCFAYELAVIIHRGLIDMYQEKKSCFYYITVMNENYPHPPMPANCAEGIIAGLYLLRTGQAGLKTRAQLMGSGTILNEVIEAAHILEADYGVATDVWSVPGLNQATRQAQDCERWNMLHPDADARVSYITSLFNKHKEEHGDIGPLVIATDYVRAYAEQLRAYIPVNNMRCLGTDGFGRSDRREVLRHFFEVGCGFIVTRTLMSLVEQGKIDSKQVHHALNRFNIDPEKPNPLHC